MLAAALLAGLPSTASGQQLNWGSCAAPPDTPAQTFACDTNDGPSFDLIVSMDPFTLMENVTRADIRVWFRSSQGTLPSWWALQGGGCRASAFTVDSSAPFPPGCGDPWLGQAVVSAEILSCAPGTLNFELHAVMPSGQTRTLTPGTRYAMFRMRFSRASTTGTGACSGCAFGGCFGTDVISIGNSAGLGWSDSPGNMAVWQNSSACTGGAFCGATPTRASTWGNIKSLYR